MYKLTEFGISVREDNYRPDMDVVNEIIKHDSYKLWSILPIVKKAKLVIDIGAHIGCFAIKLHSLNPIAAIECVEVCPENIELLRYNVEKFSTVHHAACTYLKKQIWLLNSITGPNSSATGGSCIREIDRIEQPNPKYWEDHRPINTITLEQILEKYPGQNIDILKLDCEGSEYSILENTTVLDRVICIVGEYHTRDRWVELISRKFSDWKYTDLDGIRGIAPFHLKNRKLYEQVIGS